jgi:hypothetical protein
VRVLAHVAIGAGIAMFAARYVFWPIGGPRLSAPGLLNIGGIVGVIVGARIARSSAGAVRRSVEVPAAVAALVGTFCLIWLGLAPAPAAELPLERHDFPGLSLDLFDGDTKQQILGFDSGDVNITNRSRDTAAVNLNWSGQTTAMTPAEAQTALKLIFKHTGTPGTAVQVEETTVDGHEAFTAYGGSNPALRGTFWYCEHDKRAIYLLTAAPDRDSTKALHERILATVDCHTEPDHPSDDVSRKLPQFGSDHRVALFVASGTPATLISADGEIMMVQPVAANVVQGMREKPGMVRDLLSIDPTTTIESLDESARSVQNGDGGTRDVWQGVGVADGQRLNVFLSPLACGDANLLLMSFTARTDETRAPMPQLVVDARCPGPYEFSFREPEELAAEVCRDGRVAACGAFGVAVDASKLTGWLTEACHAGKQDACAVVDDDAEPPAGSGEPRPAGDP